MSRTARHRVLGKVLGKLRCALSAILLSGLCFAAPTGSSAVAAAELQPKRLAVIVKNQPGIAQHARSGSRAVAARLKDLGYAFLQFQDGTCSATDRDIVELDAAQLNGALGCAETVTGLAEIVVLHYAGPLAVADGANYIVPASGEPANQRIAVADLLQGVAARTSFVGVVIIDAAEPASADPDIRAQQKFLRIASHGRRRILSYSAPAGEVSEPGTQGMGSYTFRLLPLLDAEIAKARRGEPLTDLRELLRNRDLVTSKAWPGRTSEVLVEDVGVEPITFAGRSRSLQPDDRTQVAAAAQPPSCGAAYQQIARGASCQAMFDFQKRCRDTSHTAMVSMALRLRCADELLEQKYKAMQASFGTAQQQNSCSAMNRFIEQHSLDFELADAPEMEKAAALRTRLCEQEAREQELAALETNLRRTLGENDCAAFRRFERQSGARLSPEQSDRLTSSIKRRCEQEEKATATLRSCLEQVESGGNFCGASACFSAFRNVLPQDTYFAAHRTESQRQEKICREFGAMRSCFSSDECGGERCSLPLRLAVGNGPLITHIQRSEQEAGRRCTAKQERERQAALDAERARQRRLDEQRADARRDATFKLTLCNRSRHANIWVTLSYFDYDQNDWIVEGWWGVDKGDCDYIGDRFRRGNFYFYAYTAGGQWTWSGDLGLCTQPVKFRRVGNGKVTCPTDRFRKFRNRQVTSSEYTLSFD